MTGMKSQPTIALETLGVSLVLVAKTSGSVCLDIRKGNTIQRGLGWLDIHYPCDGHTRAEIRGMVPEELLKPEALRSLVTETFRWLEISANEAWELRLCSPQKQVGMSNPANAEGRADRIDTTRRFRLPKDDAE
jgi:hypothetical protein